MARNLTHKSVNGQLVEMSEDEIAAKTAEWNEMDAGQPARELDNLREERNAKLAETDWVVTMHKELGTNIPAAWKTYRQALRDITNTYSSRADVVWPTKPTE